MHFLDLGFWSDYADLDVISKPIDTALNPYLHVRFERTATFSTVLHAHLMYKSIAKDCKKICMALF